MQRKKEQVKQKLGEPLFYFDDAKTGQREITIYASECNQAIVTFDPTRALSVTETLGKPEGEENVVE